MPLILAPYTLGTQLPAAPVQQGGAAYFLRWQQWWLLCSIILTCWVAH